VLFRSASSCSRQHATTTTGAERLSPTFAAAATRPLAPAPPAASSSAPPACRCSCRAPCTPCRRYPPRPSLFSHSSPAGAQLTSDGSTGGRQRRRWRRRSVGPRAVPGDSLRLPELLTPQLGPSAARQVAAAEASCGKLLAGRFRRPAGPDASAMPTNSPFCRFRSHRAGRGPACRRLEFRRRRAGGGWAGGSSRWRRGR